MFDLFTGWNYENKLVLLEASTISGAKWTKEICIVNNYLHLFKTSRLVGQSTILHCTWSIGEGGRIW
jgi:hypothetical protein